MRVHFLSVCAPDTVEASRRAAIKIKTVTSMVLLTGTANLMEGASKRTSD